MRIQYGDYCLSEKYRSYTQKLLWECENKHTWKDTPWAIIRNKKWCEDCD